MVRGLSLSISIILFVLIIHYNLASYLVSCMQIPLDAHCTVLLRINYEVWRKLYYVGILGLDRPNTKTQWSCKFIRCSWGVISRSVPGPACCRVLSNTLFLTSFFEGHPKECARNSLLSCPLEHLDPDIRSQGSFLSRCRVPESQVTCEERPVSEVICVTLSKIAWVRSKIGEWWDMWHHGVYGSSWLVFRNG